MLLVKINMDELYHNAGFKKNFNIYFTSSLCFSTNWTINEKEILFLLKELLLLFLEEEEKSFNIS